MTDIIKIGEKQPVSLKDFTPARVELGRTGVSLPTRNHLEFQLAHAQARDAVYTKLSMRSVCEEFKQFGLPLFALTTAASDREVYLRRPDLGRQLSAESEALLANVNTERWAASAEATPDVVFVIADGLSATAVERHAAALLRHVLPLLPGWRVGPICLIEQGRVAVGDAIGAVLEASIVVVLIGERPGLSSPDSLGAYLTWEPRVGRLDAERNCVSNIRGEGLSYAAAAETITYLMRQSRARKLSGVELKENDAARNLH